MDNGGWTHLLLKTAALVKVLVLSVLEFLCLVYYEVEPHKFYLQLHQILIHIQTCKCNFFFFSVAGSSVLGWRQLSVQIFTKSKRLILC